MKCPKCNKQLQPGKTVCSHCGARFAPKSEKVAHQMSLSGRFAVVCGCLLIILALLLLFNEGGDLFWASVLGALGAIIIIVGKKVT